MPNFQAQPSLPTVLLIDDDLVSREVMATVLTMSGYTVLTAAGGAAALDLLSAGECVPGVILMDAQMPGLSGTQLIQELRARSQAGVFAISGSGAPDDVVAAADGFLLKPFGADALRKLLEENEVQGGHAAQASPSSNPPALDSVDPVVSPETLARLREMMPEAAVRQIYAAIVADLGRRLSALELAIANGDAAQVSRIGHAIKGGCGMAGALQAARLGALLESGPSEPKGNHLDNTARLLRDLRAATRHLERMLETEFPV